MWEVSDVLKCLFSVHEKPHNDSSQQYHAVVTVGLGFSRWKAELELTEQSVNSGKLFFVCFFPLNLFSSLIDLKKYEGELYEDCYLRPVLSVICIRLLSLQTDTSILTHSWRSE